MRINPIGNNVNFGKGYLVYGPEKMMDKFSTVFSTPQAKKVGYTYIEATDFFLKNLTGVLYLILKIMKRV